MARTRLGVDLIVHATENVDALARVLAEKLAIDPKRIRRTKTAGHFGNPIVMLRAELAGAEAGAVISVLRAELGWGGGEESVSEIAEHVHDGVLYVRLDKQDLAGGRIVRSPGGAVRVRIAEPAYAGGRAADVYAELFAA